VQQALSDAEKNGIEGGLVRAFCCLFIPSVTEFCPLYIAYLDYDVYVFNVIVVQNYTVMKEK